MTHSKQSTALVLMMAVLMAGCSREIDDGIARKDILLRGPDDQLIGVKAEIADEPAEHMQGLMHRTELAPDHGMLFVFDQPAVRSFWMKNTLIPLDVLFFDAAGKLVSTRTMTPCEVDPPSPAAAGLRRAGPCRSYSSGAPAVSALEMPAGFVANNKIGPEWTMRY